MTNVKEQELVEKKELRDEMISKIEVLEKVKDLILLPETELAMTSQVANYFEVDKGIIENYYKSPKLKGIKEELISDGMKMCSNKDIKGEIGKNFKTLLGNELKIPPRGTYLFPKRAILRIAMVLKKSKIAREIRTQLLNIVENTTNETKTKEIDEEQQMLLNIIGATSKEDQAIALGEYRTYSQRHIKKLEDKIDTLVEGVLTWDARAGINRMMRKIAGKVFKGSFNGAFDKLYAELLYKHKIGIRHRKKRSNINNPTMFDVLEDGEMKLVVKSCVSLCEMYNINIDDLMMEQEA